MKTKYVEFWKQLMNIGIISELQNHNMWIVDIPRITKDLTSLTLRDTTLMSHLCDTIRETTPVWWHWQCEKKEKTWYKIHTKSQTDQLTTHTSEMTAVTSQVHKSQLTPGHMTPETDTRAVMTLTTDDVTCWIWILLTTRNLVRLFCLSLCHVTWIPLTWGE